MTDDAFSSSSENFDEVLMGDALANDEKLESARQDMAETINTDSRASYKHWEKLKDLALCLAKPFTGLSSIVVKGVSLFSNLVPSIIRAKAESEKTKAEGEAILITAKADANVKNAQADKIKSDTSIGQARADEARAKTKRKDKILKLLEAKGIERGAEMQGEILRILFSKDGGDSDS